MNRSLNNRRQTRWKCQTTGSFVVGNKILNAAGDEQEVGGQLGGVINEKDPTGWM